jgi:3-deoxy-D-manno-octulosonic-acid transferase
MSFFLRWVYSLIFIPLFATFMRLAGIFNVKIAKGLKGRKNLFTHLRSFLKPFQHRSPRIWIHISSLGEYEQARPVIRALKDHNPDLLLVITFFSPSGFQNAHDENADIVTYLPLDSRSNARQFFDLVRPDVALIVRHDIWPNFLWHAKERGVSLLLIDASISPHRFKTYYRLRFLVRPIISLFDQVMVVSEQDGKRLEHIVESASIRVIGDTRYDQVYFRAHEKAKIEDLTGIFSPEQTIVLGSTWPSDERVLLPPTIKLLSENPTKKVIIAPHEVTREHIEQIQKSFNDNNIKNITLSNLLDRKVGNFSVLVVDKIGLLANIYGLSDLAFVGGSFGPGVHNVLEPAAHGCGVFFGPRHINSPEAMQLVRQSAAKVVHTSKDVEQLYQEFYTQKDVLHQVGQAAQTMVLGKMGATMEVVDYIKTCVSK